MEDILKSVSPHLFAEEDSQAFALLDGASIPGLLEHLSSQEPEHECLYRGELKLDMAEVAPYLVRLEPDSEFTGWVVEQGWGKHWGIFAVSHADIRVLRRHFRTFLTVHDSDGKPLIFRYYDPRVLRVYLPTCDAKELEIVFGPVVYFLLEDESPDTILRFRAASGSLQQEKIPIAQG